MRGPDKQRRKPEGAGESGVSKYPTVRHSDEAWRRIEARLKAENAELLDALEVLLSGVHRFQYGYEQARAALAKAGRAQAEPVEPER